MISVVGVRFRTAGKIYYFDPLAFDIQKGDHVIVETARGIEYGTVVGGKKQVTDDQDNTTAKAGYENSNAKRCRTRGK